MDLFSSQKIQDTLKSSPPEKKVMKKATSLAILITTVFYLLCGLVGYAAFGSGAPGNLLTGFSSFKPFWIMDVANICIIIHLVGAYQVISNFHSERFIKLLNL